MRTPIVLTRGTWPHRAVLLALAALAVLALLWASGLAQFRVSQLTSVFIYAIAISGLNLATGYTGLLSIGHSAFFGLGAYTTGVLVMRYNLDPLSTVVPAVLLCFVIGFVIGLPALRIRGLYLALVTLAVGVAFPELVRRFESLTGGARGLVIRRRLLNPPPWSGFGAGERAEWLFWLSAVTLGAVLVLVHLLVRSRAGLAMVATRDNEIAAAASGVRVAAVKTTVFGLSGAVTGLAGCLFAMYLAALSPDGSFTLLKSIEFITGLVIGGAATRLGPLVGAFAVVYIPYLTASLNPANVSQGQLSGVLFGVVLILIIFLMPDGIVGGLSRLSGRLVQVHTPTPASEENTHEASPLPGGRGDRDLTARGVQ
ncbi:branched-chain amino acid ABC transporter permease [Dactylosporangium sp. NPDC049140]|uniref:branched-chain amino acid ABC transporter permease n=1 Tax=Dactylosporangium sp. NPDC049140 TaxID=3155647 RepID=UPI0033D2BA57